MEREKVGHQVAQVGDVPRVGGKFLAVAFAVSPCGVVAREFPHAHRDRAVEGRAGDVDRVAADERAAVPWNVGQQLENVLRVLRGSVPFLHALCRAVSVPSAADAENGLRIVGAPCAQPRCRKDGFPRCFHQRRVFSVAACTQLVQHVAVRNRFGRPCVGREEAEGERVRVARFGPQDVAFAERIVLDDFLPFFDERIVGADVEGVLVGEEHGIGVRELSDYVPIGEDTVGMRRLAVGLVVPEDHPVLVERLEVFTHFFRFPGVVEVPAGNKQFCVGVVASRHVEELVERLHLEVEVRLAVFVAAALAEADGVEKARLGRAFAVGVYGGLRQFPVLVGPIPIADVPHAQMRLGVRGVGLREKRRLFGRKI